MISKKNLAGGLRKHRKAASAPRQRSLAKLAIVAVAVCFVGNAVAGRVLHGIGKASSATSTREDSATLDNDAVAATGIKIGMQIGSASAAAVRRVARQASSQIEPTAAHQQTEHEATGSYTAHATGRKAAHPPHTATDPNAAQQQQSSGLLSHLASQQDPPAQAPVVILPTADPPVQTAPITAQPFTPTTVGSGGIKVVTSNPISISNPTEDFAPSKTLAGGGGLLAAGAGLLGGAAGAILRVFNPLGLPLP